MACEIYKLIQHVMGTILLPVGERTFHINASQSQEINETEISIYWFIVLSLSNINTKQSFKDGLMCKINLLDVQSILEQTYFITNNLIKDVKLCTMKSLPFKYDNETFEVSRKRNTMCGVRAGYLAV